MANRIPQIALIAMLAISVIVALLFFLGGDVDPNAEYLEPNNTGMLLGWAYFLVGAVCVVTLVAAGIGFITKISSDAKAATTSLVSIVALALLLCITYFAADTHPLPLVEGTEQSEFDLRISGMCIVSAFILAGIAAFVSLFGFLAKRF
ncbi:MAG: hypothetical protein IK005_09335 [Paludibacteraceae bacterium]|nr:hypothetical protein [Paludibacteraceae bacterium]MBR4840665.1 hypothetical protein [Paludibacteraceae bacterium]